VLFIHGRLTDRTGGDHCCARGLLASAVARPQRSSQQRSPLTQAKAAALSAVAHPPPPFLDGNKRTGITAAALLLGNGRGRRPEQRRNGAFYAVTNGQITLDEMALWFGAYTTTAL
jgi:prophage maintenance system killer protein